jgi:hydrogenase expression/formation protein HypE
MSTRPAAPFTAVSCPLPLPARERIVLGHGGGGALSRELVETIFLPAFASPLLERLADSTVLDLGASAGPGWAAGPGRIAFSTDSFVVRPLFFPGGSIGDLAVNGTVNDLAMSGAVPLALSAGFIVEEGFPLSDLAEVVGSMAAAARRAGVSIVAGDTKVVERGRGDGCYINTSGLGLVPAGVDVGQMQLQAGDVVLVSGPIGGHGMAIMSVREGLEFESRIESDTAPLHGLVAAMLAASPSIPMLRDPTRGGVAASLNELAIAGGRGIAIDEATIPVAAEVADACEILGLDPLHVASEGRLLAVVPAANADAVLAAMRRHEHGRDAAAIGTVVDDHPGRVVARTALGAARMVPMPLGEQLPRIC